MKTRSPLVLNTLVNQNTDLQAQAAWAEVLLNFQVRVLLPGIEKALQKLNIQ